MYKILKITRKRNSNFNLYIQNYKYEKLEVHLEILYEFNIHREKELDEVEFSKLMEINEKKLAKQQAIKILTSSSKTKKEIILKLKEKNFSKDSIQYALSFIEEYKLIDEESIAENLVKGSYFKKKYSKRMITSKLRQKGIDSNIVENLLTDFDEENEYENALYYAKKKLKLVNSTDKNVIKRKLFSTLNYRGFNYSTIQKVIKEIIG